MASEDSLSDLKITCGLQKLLLKQDTDKSSIHELYSITQELNNLKSATQMLNAEIQNQVSSNYKDLMSQTIWLQKLEVVLKIMQEHVQILLSGIERLQCDIVEPVHKIGAAITILIRLHKTSDLIRKSMKAACLMRNIKANIGKDRANLDTFKTNIDLKELESLLMDQNVRKIYFLENAAEGVQELQTLLGTSKHAITK